MIQKGKTKFSTEVPGTLIRRIDMSPKSKLHYKVTNLLALSAAFLALPVGSALAQEWTLEEDQLVEQPAPYSPYVDQHFPQQVFFGDTHFHSSLSVDSGLIGNKLDLDQAFRFARGEEVRTSAGLRAKLNRPLDFLVVSDHAEYLGIADLLNTANPELLATEAGQEWYQAMQEGGDKAWQTVIEMIEDFQTGTPRFKNPKVERSVWERVVDIASNYNEPGAFTAMYG